MLLEAADTMHGSTLVEREAYYNCMLALLYAVYIVHTVEGTLLFFIMDMLQIPMTV